MNSFLVKTTQVEDLQSALVENRFRKKNAYKESFLVRGNKKLMLLFQYHNPDYDRTAVVMLDTDFNKLEVK